LTPLNLAEPTRVLIDSRDATPQAVESEEEQSSDEPMGPRLWGGGMVESSESYSVPGASYFFHGRRGLSYEERRNTRNDISVMDDDETPLPVPVVKAKRAPSPSFEMSKDVMDNIERMIEKLKNREPSEEEFSISLKWELREIAQQVRGPNGSFKGYKLNFQKTNFMFVNSRRDELLPAVTEMIDQFDSKVTDITQRIGDSEDQLAALMEARDLLSMHLKGWQKLVSDCKNLFTRERNAKKAQKTQQEASAHSASGPGTSGTETVNAGVKRKQPERGKVDVQLKDMADETEAFRKKNKQDTAQQTQPSSNPEQIPL
jgi:hypothetical protein